RGGGSKELEVSPWRLVIFIRGIRFRLLIHHLGNYSPEYSWDRLLSASVILYRRLTVEAVLISLPVTIFVAGILLTNNIRDVDGDKANGRNTFAILVGRKKATTTLAGM